MTTATDIRLIETRIEQYTDLIKEMKATKKYQKTNTNPADTNEFILDSLSKVNWTNIKAEIERYLQQQNHIDALKAVEIALEYLTKKGYQDLNNSEHAYSNNALKFDQLARIPVIGTFFDHPVQHYHREGIAKTLLRLDEITRWLDTLEKHFPTSIASKLLDFVSN